MKNRRFGDIRGSNRDHNEGHQLQSRQYQLLK